MKKIALKYINYTQATQKILSNLTRTCRITLDYVYIAVQYIIVMQYDKD